VDYRDAKTSKEQLAEMLVHTKGQRRVPVIVEGGHVTVGYGGT
jgi:glutaredoxin 3